MTTPNINPSDLDREALNKAYEAYDKAFPESGFITYEGLRAGIRAYLTTLPRASGVPEAEAVAYIVHHEADGERFLAYSADVGWFKERGYTTEPLYAAPPPVAAPSGERERATMLAVVDFMKDMNSDLPHEDCARLFARRLKKILAEAPPSPIASEPKDAGSGEGLKPCPFCGKQPETHYHYDGMDIYGVGCGGHAGFDGETLKEASDKWNTRTAPSWAKP